MYRMGRGSRGSRRGMQANRTSIPNEWRSTAQTTLSSRNSRMQHNPKVLELAVANVRAGKMTQTKASEIFGIPRQTIGYHLTRKNEPTDLPPVDNVHLQGVQDPQYYI